MNEEASRAGHSLSLTDVQQNAQYVAQWARTYGYTYVHTYVHTYIHTSIHTYVHIHIHTYTCTYSHTHSRTHTYVPIESVLVSKDNVTSLIVQKHGRGRDDSSDRICVKNRGSSPGIWYYDCSYLMWKK